MYFNVHIKPSGYNLSVQPGETVFDAAERQGYYFPHECLSGICATCRGQILAGEVDYLEFPVALSEEEREEGWALFCSATPLSDLIIQVPGVIGPEQLPIKALSYQIEEFRSLSPSFYQLILKPPAEEAIDFHPGQYIEILQADTNPKPFSIAIGNLLAGNKIELHIQHRHNSTYTQSLIEELKLIGREIKIRGPLGSCILKRDPPYPYLFVAGGSGVVPHKALIEQILAEDLKRPIYLYWGVRELEDLYLDELFKRWQKHIPYFHYKPILSGEQDQWSGIRGLVHEVVLQDHADLAKFHTYVSGPSELVYAALHTFQNHGLKRHFFYSDTLDRMSNE